MTVSGAAGRPENVPPAENRFELVFEASGVVGKGTAQTVPAEEESTGDQE